MLLLMAQRFSKSNKRKYGLTPGYTPKMLSKSTDEANIPLVQRNGGVRYVSEYDLKWLIKNGKIDGITAALIQADPRPLESEASQSD